MEFIFGNSGKGYGLMLKNDSRDEGISEHLQKVGIFNTPVSENLYAYKIITDGRTFTTIFNMFSGDTAFERGAHYNHVKWVEAGREYFLHRDFFEKMLSGFAQQNDIEQLRKGSENVGFAINTSVPAVSKFNRDVLLGALHALHTDENKILIGLDAIVGYDFDATARGFIYAVFENLNVNLRITTPYVTSCGIDVFKDSPYRLCVVPSAKLLGGAKDGIVTIGTDYTFSKADEWAEYLEWVVDINTFKKDDFFAEYDNLIGKYELGASDLLLEYYFAQKEGAQRLSKIFLDSVSNVIASGDEFAVPKIHRELLQGFHNSATGNILTSADKINLLDVESFIKENNRQLLYLSSVYGDKLIPELEMLISNSLPKSLDEPLEDSDLAGMSSIETLISEYSTYIRSQNDAGSLVFSRILFYLNKYYNYLVEGYKYKEKNIESIRTSFASLSTINEIDYYNVSTSSSDRFRFDFSEVIEVARVEALYRGFALERLNSQHIRMPKDDKEDLMSAFLTYVERLKSEEDALVNRVKELVTELDSTKRECSVYKSERDTARRESDSYSRTIEKYERSNVTQSQMSVSSHSENDWEPRDLWEVVERQSRDSLLSKSIIQELEHYHRQFRWELPDYIVDEMVKKIGRNEENLSRFIEVQFSGDLDLDMSVGLWRQVMKNQYTKELAFLHKISIATTYNSLAKWIENYSNAIGKITTKNENVYTAIYNGMRNVIDDKPSQYHNFGAKIPGTDKGLLGAFAVEIASNYSSLDISEGKRSKSNKIVAKYFKGNGYSGGRAIKIAIVIITIISLGALAFFGYRFFMPDDVSLNDYNINYYDVDDSNEHEYGDSNVEDAADTDTNNND